MVLKLCVHYTNLKECELASRLEIQPSGHFFRHLEVMGKNFQKACGRIAFGIMFFLHWIVLLTWFVEVVVKDISRAFLVVYCCEFVI